MIGQAIGHFTVIDKLGEGAQGAVYLATDKKLERKVALKILLPHSLESEALYHRFVLEAKAAASLDHPRLLSITPTSAPSTQLKKSMSRLSWRWRISRVRLFARRPSGALFLSMKLLSSPSRLSRAWMRHTTRESFIVTSRVRT
jgi:serine/threonine protein kinase